MQLLLRTTLQLFQTLIPGTAKTLLNPSGIRQMVFLKRFLGDSDAESHRGPRLACGNPLIYSVLLSLGRVVF